MSDSKLGFGGQSGGGDRWGCGRGTGLARCCSPKWAPRSCPSISSSEIAEDAAEEIRAAGGEAMGASADVTDEAGVQRLFDETIDRFGRVDTLINNVGNMRGHKPSQIVGHGLGVLGSLRGAEPQEHISLLPGRRPRHDRQPDQGRDREHRLPQRPSRLGPTGALRGGESRSHAVHQDPRRRARTPRYQSQLRRPGLDQRAAGKDPSPPVANGRDGEVRYPWGGLSEPEDIAGIAVALASDLASFVTGQIVMCDGGLACTSSRPSDAGQHRDEAEGLRREVRLGRARAPQGQP